MDSFMPISPENGGHDNRVTCRSCRNLVPWSRKCRVEPHLRHGPVIVDLARRCTEYHPIPSEPDQRLGEERWPHLAELIEEVRAMDLAYYGTR